MLQNTRLRSTMIAAIWQQNLFNGISDFSQTNASLKMKLCIRKHEDSHKTKKLLSEIIALKTKPTSFHILLVVF